VSERLTILPNQLAAPLIAHRSTTMQNPQITV
jgi:hypothetical protein